VKHDDPNPEASLETQRRELELQLQKIRSEASAARLEAKAAEVELMIRRLSAGETYRVPQVTYLSSPAATDQRRIDSPSDAAILQPQFRSWDDVRMVLHANPTPRGVEAGVTALAPGTLAPGTLAPGTLAPGTLAPGTGVSTWTRQDAAHDLPRHHFESTRPESALPFAVEPEVVQDEVVAELSSDTITEAAPVGASQDIWANLSATANHERAWVDESAVTEMRIDPEAEWDEEENRKRSRPAAWIVSTLVHVAILVLLAAVGLSTHQPKDQVALSASAPVEQVSLETFEIETNDPQTDPMPEEANPTEVAYDLSPVGEISASDLISDAPPVAASVSMSDLFKPTSAAAASLSMQPNSDATMEFCGVKGGGNHFVYLVDSSGSMGSAFESARAELLRSISLLKPDQRFYVVFFDAQSDYMRLSDPNVDEPRSVKATRENKVALQQWAMRIRMDRGRAPYEPLRFALKLKPDVIFLLSDGEFPQGIEDMLKEENRVVNLFGDDDRISIIHTIGYHSKEGESRMRRIAEQHGGMYRYVPKPR